jgi:hypothetical protein
VKKEAMGRQGRRSKPIIMYDLKEMRGYWKLKAETLDTTFWRTCLGRGYGPVVDRLPNQFNHFD